MEAGKENKSLLTLCTDRELVLRLANNDQPAFDMLFTRYHNRLFVYIYKVTKSREAAEEIVLDVFLKIWAGRASAKEIDNFEAFLFMVARNKALDFLRQVQKSRSRQAALWARLQENAAAEGADSKLLLSAMDNEIQQAAGRLSPQRRMVFQLSREHGLTYMQIAERLQLSPLTVRNHLSAALQYIRSQLDTLLLLAAVIASRLG